MAPVEEDGGIVGRYLVRQAHGTALHELQGECGESVTLLELLAHVSSHKLHMATLLLANGPLAVCVRRAVYTTNILTVSLGNGYRDLARFLTGSALGLGVLAKASPDRQALEGYARAILSVLA